MTTGATGQLGLALPVQGELSGTWGDTVNNGITQYTNIAIAATLTLTNDGAVTLANTSGDASASNITSTLTGAGTVTAQFAIVRVTGTLTTAKVVTAPSYSKTYTVVNAATGGIVTFKASGQTGVSIAVGESAFVYYNGTDYVKVAGTAITSSQWITTGSDIYYNTGNVGIGTSTPASKLHLQDTTQIRGVVSSSTNSVQFWKDATPTFAAAIGCGTPVAGLVSALTFELFDGSSWAEGMRLTSTGLGIGTSSPAYKLDLYTTAQFSGRWANATRAGYLYTDSGGPGIFNTAAYGSEGMYLNAASNYIQFVTNSAESVRITSAGNLGVGTTSPTDTFSFTKALDVNGSSGAFVYVRNNGSATNVGGIGYSGSDLYVSNQAAGNIRFLCNTSASERARISSTGGFSVGTTADPGAGAIYATGNITAYYSDARLKTVSGKIENALDKVAQLSGVYYTNNSVAKSFGYDSDEVQVGVLAQDVEAVLPQIVKAAPFDLDENGNSKSGENYKTVQYEKLVPLLIEAINELQAKVKALESK